MKQWNNIIQTALIGTEKKPLAIQDFETDLAEVLATVQANNQIDNEEKFLQTAAIVYNYTNCGTQPLLATNFEQTFADEEENDYCNQASEQVLKDILLEESIPLLQLWLQQCKDANQLIPPQLLPTILDKAVQHKYLKSLVESCMGNRGVWLGKFNTAWQFANPINQNELWQTGTLEQRKLVLQKCRETDVEKAIVMLQETWQHENATNKQHFLEVIEPTVTSQDVQWLESLNNEKSKLVKDQILQLLKKIPESSVVKLYTSVIQKTITVTKEKTLLGLSSKLVLHIALPDLIDTAIFKTGIDELSNQKEFSDKELTVFQLLSCTPPDVLEKYLQLKPHEIIELFQIESANKKFIPAIVSALCTFKNTTWALAVMQYSSVFYLDILPFIPSQQQEYYSIKFFKDNENSIIRYSLSMKNEWSVELTKLIFTYLAANPYQYYRSFYNQQIHLIPQKALTILEACTPADENAKNIWNNTKEYIEKLLQLKQQIHSSV